MLDEPTASIFMVEGEAKQVTNKKAGSEQSPRASYPRVLFLVTTLTASNSTQKAYTLPLQLPYTDDHCQISGLCSSKTMQ
jgi:hypothetical protein